MSKFVDSTFLIVGLARNCANRIEKDLDSLYAAFSEAKKVMCIVVESDSSDHTVDILENLRTKVHNFSYISFGNLRDIHPKRTQRIAYCRNQYLRLIASDKKFSSVDFVVVADLDGVNSKLSPDAVKSCWVRDDWDVCTANQAGPYYDIWALRHPLWSPNDCWEQVRFLKKMSVSSFNSIYLSVYSRMIRIDRSAPWIEVDSAFGGLAIYKKSFVVSSDYVGLNDGEDEICEHVCFHRKIRELGGRIFINPALINAGQVEHARYAGKFGLIVFWFKCFIKDLTLKIGLYHLLRKLFFK